MLASYGFFQGGTIGNLLAQWEQAGVFSYILPFLLIFALVFGILSKTKIFTEKSVNAVIALAVSLMSLQFPIVSQFFAEIFPRLGIGLSIILLLLILTGLFIDPTKKGIWYTFFGIGALIAIIVIANSVTAVGWLSSSWFGYGLTDNLGMIIAGVLLIAGIAAILGKKKDPPKVPTTYIPYAAKEY